MQRQGEQIDVTVAVDVGGSDSQHMRQGAEPHDCLSVGKVKGEVVVADPDLILMAVAVNVDGNMAGRAPWMDHGCRRLQNGERHAGCGGQQHGDRRE